jgi:hypothetical protein
MLRLFSMARQSPCRGRRPHIGLTGSALQFLSCRSELLRLCDNIALRAISPGGVQRVAIASSGNDAVKPLTVLPLFNWRAIKHGYRRGVGLGQLVRSRSEVLAPPQF